jgi:O-antigen ligase
MFVNGSFGPILAVIVGFLGAIVLFAFVRKEKLKRVAAALLIFLAVMGLTNLKTPRIENDVRIFSGDIKEVITNDEKAAKAGSGRWELWVAGVQFALERPVFGYGPDNLGPQYQKLDFDLDRPHNELIQFAASLGFPALMFYLLAMLGHLVRFLRSAKRLSPLLLGIFVAVGTYLVSSLFGNTMYYTTPYFFAVLGISAGLLNMDAQTQMQNRGQTGDGSKLLKKDPSALV